MELRSGRVVDDIPVVSSDSFCLVEQSSSIEDFDGFTAREVPPHRHLDLATELLPAETFGFTFPVELDSSSEYEPSDTESSNGSCVSTHKPAGSAALKQKSQSRPAATRDTFPLGDEFPFTFTSKLPAPPVIFLPSLSAEEKERYTPLRTTSHRPVAAASPVIPHRTLFDARSPKGVNGTNIGRTDGGVIRMAPGIVRTYTDRLAIRKAERYASAVSSSQGNDLEDRPCKVPRLGDGQASAPSSKHRGPQQDAPSVARDVSRPRTWPKKPKTKTPAQLQRARLRRQGKRAAANANPRHASKSISQAAIVDSKIDVQSHVTGKSAFTAPARVRDTQLGSSTSQTRAPRLHPAVSSTVRELVSKGALYVPANDNGLIFTDKSGRIYGATAAVPKDATLRASLAIVGDLITKLSEELKICHAENVASTNTRGAFNKCQVGTSFGGGQMHPTQFSTDIGTVTGYRSPRMLRNRRLLAAFFKNPDVRRVVKHMQSCADTYFPEVMETYRKLNKDLNLNDAFRLDGEDDDDINFYFAATTFNLGPQVATVFHRDAMNLQQGICAIMAFGDYNAKTSGHFLMKEPNVVLEFRPGDILFVLSALITHGNAPLKPWERRTSWTFYTAGGLFRWRAAGERRLNMLHTDRERRAYLAAAKSWSHFAWGNLMTLDELKMYYS